MLVRFINILSERFVLYVTEVDLTIDAVLAGAACISLGEWRDLLKKICGVCFVLPINRATSITYFRWRSRTFCSSKLLKASLIIFEDFFVPKWAVCTKLSCQSSCTFKLNKLDSCKFFQTLQSMNYREYSTRFHGTKLAALALVMLALMLALRLYHTIVQGLACSLAARKSFSHIKNV